MLEQVLASMGLDEETITKTTKGLPITLLVGKDHAQSEEAGGIFYQRYGCGGGRRILRKRIGSN